MTLKEDRVMHWLKVGAKPTDTVRSLLKYEGLLFRQHLRKKGESEENVESKVRQFIESRGEKIQRARDKKVRRKLAKKTKPAEGSEATAAAPAAEAPAPQTEA